MPMMESQFNDSFKVFPYREDYKDGRTNNGGIDLTQEPWRIDEITEAIDFPELRRLIAEFNNSESPFMSLGCEAGEDDGLYYGYIEFTFRDECMANDLSFIREFDEALYSWAGKQGNELEKALRNVLKWEYSYYSHHGSSQRIKVTATFRAPDKSYAGKILDTIRVYFMKDFHAP